MGFCCWGGRLGLGNVADKAIFSYSSHCSCFGLFMRCWCKWKVLFLRGSGDRFNILSILFVFSGLCFLICLVIAGSFHANLLVYYLLLKIIILYPNSISLLLMGHSIIQYSNSSSSMLLWYWASGRIKHVSELVVFLSIIGILSSAGFDRDVHRGFEVSFFGIYSSNLSGGSAVIDSLFSLCSSLIFLNSSLGSFTTFRS